MRSPAVTRRRSAFAQPPTGPLSRRCRTPSARAEITRGEADARRNRIYAEAFGNNADFFAFYRSLTALERTLQPGNSTLVFSPDSEFLAEMFSAIRADGLESVDVDGIDIDKLREMAPEQQISEDLPEAERLRLEQEQMDAEDDGAGATDAQ